MSQTEADMNLGLSYWRNGYQKGVFAMKDFIKSNPTATQDEIAIYALIIVDEQKITHQDTGWSAPDQVCSNPSAPKFGGIYHIIM